MPSPSPVRRLLLGQATEQPAAISGPPTIRRHPLGRLVEHPHPPVHRPLLDRYTNDSAITPRIHKHFVAPSNNFRPRPLILLDRRTNGSTVTPRILKHFVAPGDNFRPTIPRPPILPDRRTNGSTVTPRILKHFVAPRNNIRPTVPHPSTHRPLLDHINDSTVTPRVLEHSVAPSNNIHPTVPHPSIHGPLLDLHTNDSTVTPRVLEHSVAPSNNIHPTVPHPSIHGPPLDLHTNDSTATPQILEHSVAPSNNIRPTVPHPPILLDRVPQALPPTPPTPPTTPSLTPLIRKVKFTQRLVRGPRVYGLRITRYTALPEFRLEEGESRGAQFIPGVKGIRKVESGWGTDDDALKVRKVWGTPFDPSTEDLPYDPADPIKIPPPSALAGELGTEGGSPARIMKSTPLMGCLSVGEHKVGGPDVKTTYVDTHCHLTTTLRTLKDSTGDETIPQDALDIFVKTIFPPQVSAVVDIHCDLPHTDYEKAATLDWPDHLKYYFSVGVHPRCAMSYTDEVHESIIKAMSHPSCVAWGECGIDYFKSQTSIRPTSTRSTQCAVFARQLTAAVELGKPIVVHTREADEDTLTAIREHVPKDHRLHIHCFTSGPNLAKTILNEYPNAYIGLTGVISYSGIDHVTDLIRKNELPVDRMLLETDSPYMVPKGAYEWLVREQPKNKKRRFLASHSGMIPFTAQKIKAEINKGRRYRGEEQITLEELLDITRKNAAKMYDIDV